MIKLFGYEYAIECKDSISEMDAFGRYHSKTLTIQIANNICPQQKVSTLIHEVLEAINYHLNVKLKHEAICQLETGLMDFLSSNNLVSDKLLDLLPEEQNNE